MATASSSSTSSSASPASSTATMRRMDGERSDPQLSAQLMQLLGSGKREAEATPTSASTSTTSSSGICATPKSRKSTGRLAGTAVPRRNLFVATAQQAAAQSQKGPSSKRSSSVVSPSLALMQALCVTPKSSTAPVRSASNSKLGCQRHAATTSCMSILASPAVLQRVTIQELFGASTSANNNASSKPRYDTDREIAALTGASPKSPSAAAQPPMFSTPTAQHHGQQQHQRQFLRRQQSASATLSGGRNGGGAGGLRTAASTAACSAAISSFRRFTPPPGKEISSPIFAASKYVESPSARSLPLPPDEWIQEALRLQHAVITEDALEDDHAAEPAARPSFFLDIGAGPTQTMTDGESAEEEDAASTASSGVVSDLDEPMTMAEDVVKKLTAVRPLLPMTSASSESAAADSGEGSMTSASDNECDSVIESAGIRMDPFSLIAAVVASAPVTPVV